MNYVILNGIKSTTVKGLIIQSLPPISKPLMRTSVEEIDGRDGDIITNLGYSAMDKAMSIGLFGDYDVDEVIKFFSGSGTVIFSNEPDKFYKYQIIAQIDFERLIRFKTAMVTFHVQPFKFSAVDDYFKVENVENFKLINRGNTFSRPKITFYGSGMVDLYLNGHLVMVFTIDSDHITIDSEEMNAYCGNVLKNRYVVGDYDTFVFKVGTNEVSWDGSVDKVEVEKYSRWI